MTEQRVETEATAFGHAVLEIADERNLFPVVPANMGLEARHVQALEAHLGLSDSEVDVNREGGEFVRATARSLGLDYTDFADYAPCMKLAYAHLFNKSYLEELKNQKVRETQ